MNGTPQNEIAVDDRCLDLAEAARILGVLHTNR